MARVWIAGILSVFMLFAALYLYGETRKTAGANVAWTSPLEDSALFDEYHTLNHISLSDSREQVWDKLGRPDEAKTDTYLPSIVIEYFQHLEIGWHNDHIQYISVTSNEESFTLNGVEIEFTSRAVLDALGQPDFIAEDGVVYTGQFNAVKGFLDDHTGELTHIDLFQR